MQGCAHELERPFWTFRYTQRGAPPSLQRPPYSIETHMADALAILDYFRLYPGVRLERVWLVGHAWGAHLALHLLVAHPDRFLGAVCVGALGAYPAPEGQGEERAPFLVFGDPEARRATNASIAEHFRRGTLVDGLPSVAVPVLFVHGERDPLPLSSVERTAALIPNAAVVPLDDCGRFPWLERPRRLRDAVESWLASR
jgi:pimeloyl-ACP methyl ester carboxylesterase